MWPCLIPVWMCTKPVHVKLGNGELSEDGELQAPFEADLSANVQFNAKQKLTPKMGMVTITGKVYFAGDICPDMPTISTGTVTIDGQSYDVYQGGKAYNPDNSVNFTVLELM